MAILAMEQCGYERAQERERWLTKIGAMAHGVELAAAEWVKLARAIRMNRLQLLPQTCAAGQPVRMHPIDLIVHLCRSSNTQPST